MGDSRRSMQDVLLLDVDVEVDVEKRPPARETPPADSRRRAHRWWPVAIGVVMTAVVASIAVDQRDDARLAELAAVPGILAPLDGAISQRWSTGPGRYTDVAAVGGGLVAVASGRDGGIAVVALDPVRGVERWRLPVRPPGPLDTWARCAWTQPAAEGAADAVGACVVVDEAATHENAAGVWPYATSASLVVIDPAAGVVLSDRPIAASATVAALGSDLVTSRVDRSGRVHVARVDPRSGAERWTFESPGPLPQNVAGRREATVSVSGDLVVVSAGSGWVLTGDGDVVRAWSGDPTTRDGGRIAVVAGGRVLVETGTTGAGATGSTIVDRTTSRTFADDGRVLATGPDDGSLDGLVFTQPSRSPDLVARDLATGGVRWTASTADLAAGGLIVLDGRVVRGEATELRAMDGGTGRTAWATTTGRSARSGLFSDGRVVLRAQLDDELGVVLAAYALDDGRLAWRTDIADDVTLLAVGGQLLGRSDAGLVAFG